MNPTLEADKILRELHQLWVTLGRAAENGESHGVLRACAMTLVVFLDDSEDTAAVAGVLAELIREHPNRAILVRLNPGAAGFEAQVRAQCWRPFGRREQICCEHVEITAGEESAADLRPVLLALTAPDLPLVLWYRSAGIYERSSFPPRALPARKAIVDSGNSAEPGAMLARLARDAGKLGAPAIADLSWTRITRWREIVAQEFENAAGRALLPEAREIRIEHGGASVPAEAYYLAAWLLSALHRDPGELRVRFQFMEGRPAGIQGVAVLSAAASLTARRWQGSDAVDVHVGSLRNCTACPPAGEAALLREELSVAGRDPVYDNSLRLAALLAAGG